MASVVGRKSHALSRQAFARLGNGSLAYVRRHRSERVGFLHAEAPLLPPGRTVFVLHAADGYPLSIAESLESITAIAEERHLDAASLH